MITSCVKRYGDSLMVMLPLSGSDHQMISEIKLASYYSSLSHTHTLHPSIYVYVHTHTYIYMIWYDMIWYDMIWYDMIWYDMIWYDMICLYVILGECRCRYVNAYVCTCIIHAHTCPYIHAYMHTCIHTYIHKYIHTYIYIYPHFYIHLWTVTYLENTSIVLVSRN